MPALLAIILEQLVIPQMAAIIRAFMAGSGGVAPTAAQITALTVIDADAAIAFANAWLAAHPEPKKDAGGTT